MEQGSSYYAAGTSYAVRAAIRLARGEAESAVTDAGRSVELTGGDPQEVVPDLALAGLVFASTQNEQQAQEALTQALARLRPLSYFGFAALELPSLAWTARALARETELSEVLEQEPFKSPWLRAAEAVLRGDLGSAADTFNEMGMPAQEAFFRLQGGAEQDVRVALSFYGGVGAIRYLREGEALLAASA